MDRAERRLAARRRRRKRRALAFVTALFGVLLVSLTGLSCATEQNATPRVDSLPRPHAQHRKHHRPKRPPRRPPQFVVVSFDGSGGSRLWPYWRSVARRAHAHFTFFVSGVYLLDPARRDLYHPPRHERGRSDIGFALAEDGRAGKTSVRAMLGQITAAYREGHEIGTHYNGHFCAPYAGTVGEWSAADWQSELAQFYDLLFHASANNHLDPPFRLPFGPSEVIGGRTPCLQGNLGVLYPVLARHGFRYDASQVGELGDWPWRQQGLWDIPLVTVPFAGHTFRVVSMDFNLLANQAAATYWGPGGAAAVEHETYRTLRRAFLASYFGKRAPLAYGSHFETWNSWAYDHALTRFLLDTCHLPEVRCTSYRELVDWLDAMPRATLRRFRAGRFPHLRHALNRG